MHSKLYSENKGVYIVIGLYDCPGCRKHLLRQNTQPNKDPPPPLPYRVHAYYVCIHSFYIVVNTM